MVGGVLNNPSLKTTSYKVVLPFYAYAAVSFLVACIMLFTSNDSFEGHYFNPRILAITHMMALGWCTMIILGACYQLVPVLIEGKLYSEKLAYVTFGLAAVGIPLLVYGFFVFNMGAISKWGGRLVLFAVISFIINILTSISKSKKDNIHAVFIFSSMIWLFFTVMIGLTLVYNFTYLLLPKDHLHYLTLHAHVGIVGWFLQLVIGVATRLVPMFMISKYVNKSILWLIFLLINAALVLFVIFFYSLNTIAALSYISITMTFIAVALFVYYCYQAYKHRLRRAVDNQVKLSLFSATVLLVPIILLSIIIGAIILTSTEKTNLVLTYGFLVFFGWLSSIIMGMTFKTMPFVVWNKVYHIRSSIGKTPNPKDLFNESIFRVMAVSFLVGLLSFTIGILGEIDILLKIGSALLVYTSFLYNWNVFKVLNHKPFKL